MSQLQSVHLTLILKEIWCARPISLCGYFLRCLRTSWRYRSTCKWHCFKILPLVYASFSVKRNEVETPIIKRASLTRDSISIDQVLCFLQLKLFNHILSNNSKWKLTFSTTLSSGDDFTSISSNVTFRPVSLERRQDTCRDIQTYSRETIKPFSERRLA